MRVRLLSGRFLTREDGAQKIRALWSPIVTDLLLAEEEARDCRAGCRQRGVREAVLPEHESNRKALLHRSDEQDLLVHHCRSRRRHAPVRAARTTRDSRVFRAVSRVADWPSRPTCSREGRPASPRRCRSTRDQRGDSKRNDRGRLDGRRAARRIYRAASSASLVAHRVCDARLGTRRSGSTDWCITPWPSAHKRLGCGWHSARRGRMSSGWLSVRGCAYPSPESRLVLASRHRSRESSRICRSTSGRWIR